MPMVGFELLLSGVGGDRSINCVTTTAIKAHGVDLLGPQPSGFFSHLA